MSASAESRCKGREHRRHPKSLFARLCRTRHGRLAPVMNHHLLPDSARCAPRQKTCPAGILVTMQPIGRPHPHIQSQCQQSQSGNTKANWVVAGPFLLPCSKCQSVQELFTRPPHCQIRTPDAFSSPRPRNRAYTSGLRWLQDHADQVWPQAMLWGKS